MIPSTSNMDNQPPMTPSKRRRNTNKPYIINSEEVNIAFTRFGHNNPNDSTPSFIIQSKKKKSTHENLPINSEEVRNVAELSGHNNDQEHYGEIQDDSTPSFIIESKRKKSTNENLPINFKEITNVAELPGHNNYGEIEDDTKWLNYIFEDKTFLISVFIDDSRGSLRDLLARLINLALEFNISSTNFLKLLQTVDYYDKSHILPTTKVALWEVLKCKGFQMIESYYCNKCPQEYFGTQETLTPKWPRCSRCAKTRPAYLESTLNYMLSISLTSQIKHLFSMPDVCQSLYYPSFRKNQSGIYKEIHNASECPSLCVNNKFSECLNFTLTVNISACKIADSSIIKAWPIYVQINEFSPYLREKYMLLAGIYIGYRPPKMEKFLAPFKAELRKLSEEGIYWKTIKGVKIKSLFKTVIWSVDSLTHANILKINEWDEYKKWINYYVQSKNPLSNKYSIPFTQLQERVKTHYEIQKLPANMYYHLIAEPMNVLFLGVAKQHMKLMMENPDADFYIGSSLLCSLIDNTLLKIKLPKYCNVKPRSILYWNDWTVHEWKNWLGCAPVCLNNLIDFKYVHHLSLLSEVAEILSGSCAPRDLVVKNPSVPQLSRVDCLIRMYISLLKEYFGIQNMSYEIYLLTQITYLVEKWGPLSSFSGFRCESWNKKILREKIINETITCQKYTSSLVIEDILTLYLQHQYMTCNNNLLTNASKHLIACMKKVETEPYTHNYQDNIDYVETSWPMEPALTPLEESFLKKANFPSALSFYNKIKRNGIEFQPYNADDPVFCNSTIVSDKGWYGVIRQIISYRWNNTTIFKICVEKFRPIRNAFDTHYIFEVELTENFVALNIDTIFPAVKIVEGTRTYVYGSYLPG